MGRSKFEFEAEPAGLLVPPLLPFPGPGRREWACPGAHAAPPSGPGRC